MELVPLLQFRIIQTHIDSAHSGIGLSCLFQIMRLWDCRNAVSWYTACSLMLLKIYETSFFKLFVKKTPRLWVWTQRRSHLCCERKLRRAKSSGELGREAMHSHSLSILVLGCFESNWSELITVRWETPCNHQSGQHWVAKAPEVFKGAYNGTCQTKRIRPGKECTTNCQKGRDVVGTLTSAFLYSDFFSATVN